MITILKGDRGVFAQVDEAASGMWVNVVAPNTDEITGLQRRLEIPHDFIVAALDVDEKARADRDEGTQLVLLRIPLPLGEAEEVPFDTLPLGIIFTDDLIVTVCSQENEVIADLLNGRVPGADTSKRNRFLLQVLLRTAVRYLRYLRQIDKEIDAIEKRVQLSMRNRELLELLRFQKSLTYFATALKSNELMMERLQRSHIFDRYPDDNDLLEDVLTENQQAIEMVGISSNILSQMMDAFASIISNNMNVVMKFLTSATIILMLPTLVASFYGMNVDLPLQHSPLALPFTLLVSLLLSSAVVAIFLKKDWF
jgi:magnesium transporter